MEPLATLPDLIVAVGRQVDAEAGAMALASASALVRDYVGWTVSEERTTFTVDGSGTTLLSLPTLRLSAVHSVRLHGVELVASATGWTAPGEYTWSARGQLYRAAGWPDAFRCAEIDATHGYAVIPDAVRAVVLALAAGSLAAVGASTLASKTVGAVSYTFRDAPASLTELQTFQLSGYRLL